jgi:hypothetical protein
MYIILNPIIAYSYFDCCRSRYTSSICELVSDQDCLVDSRRIEALAIQDFGNFLMTKHAKYI